MPVIQSKVKLSRSLGIALVPKAAKYMERRPYPPGQHGQRRRGKKSDYGLQLLEKQRLRHQYFMGERQLSNWVRKAVAGKGNTADLLIQRLERRLDVLVLRAGFARTIYQARQFVTHGHIEVNGWKMSYPSALVGIGDEISLRTQSQELDMSKQSLNPVEPPPYVTRKEDRAWLSRLPDREEVPVTCELSSVIEYYAK